jgi:5-methyltetrahydropteroyltriglutamate--homocysteine methyltransferase
VHICYGYGIKANIDWKKTLGANGASTSRPSRCSRVDDRPGVARVRELARADRADRLLKGKDVLVGAIDVAERERVETRGRRRPGDPLGAALRRARPPAPVHQLRDGPAARGTSPAASWRRSAPGAAKVRAELA